MPRATKTLKLGSSKSKKTTPTEKKETPTKTTKPNSEMARVIDTLNKKFGEGAVTLGIPKSKQQSIERISTGSLSLDVDLGGGIPVGRVIEISGGFSTSKSTQVMHIVRNAQKMGMTTAICDAEGTYDEKYFNLLDVDPSMVYYISPDSLEEGTQIILDLQREGLISLAVIDSVAAMTPNRVQDSEMDESVQMGIAPKLWGEFLGKFQMNNNKLDRAGKRCCTLIGVNQLRERIGTYGDPEYTTGGRAWGFYKSVDIRLRKGDWITQGKGDNKEVVGQVVKYKIEKNKTYKRMRVGEFDCYLTENNAGVRPLFNDTAKEVIMLGVEWDVIQRAGAWFKYKDQKYQGIENLISALKDDPELMEELTDKILKLSVNI